MNSFIPSDTSIFFIKIIKLWEFIIKVLVTGLIITLSSLIHNNPIITKFDKISTI